MTAVSALSCTGLGLLSAGLGLVVRETAVLSNILFGILLVCHRRERPARRAARMAGDARAGDSRSHTGSRRRACSRTAPRSGSVAGLVGSEALIGAIYATAGYLLIRVLEKHSRRHATLERA